MATESRQDWRVSRVRGAATTGARAERLDREDIGLAHTLLIWFRCVAKLTRRLSASSRRARGVAPRAMAFATLTLAAAGCFTSPINRAPVVTQIDEVGGPTAKGKQATFMATGSDPDQDQLTWTWATHADACPDAATPGNWPRNTNDGVQDSPATYLVNDPSLTKSSQYCVWAFATDRYGAVGAANLTVVPVDNAPVVSIQIVVDPGNPTPPPGPTYPAHSIFQLTANATDADDGDSLTYQWSLDQQPVGSNDLVTCAGDDNTNDRCFTGDVPGTYVVSVMVSDGTKTTTATTPMLIVLGDAPPCIVLTSPVFQIGSTTMLAPTTPGSYPPGSIEVKQIYEDGIVYDPMSHSTNPRFTWYVGKNEGPLQYQDNVDFYTLALGDYYQLGDHVNVRLEVQDNANASLVDATLKACLDADFCAAPTIPPGRPDCWIRVSWRFELTQPTPASTQAQ